MTLGNMRELGVQRLVASCLNNACRHVALIDVSGFPAEMEVPSFSPAREVREVRKRGGSHRRAAQLERTADVAEFDRQGLAMSRAILFDAIFAIVFATMIVTIARFLWALM
jgi:hypothetical protein